MDKYIKKIIEEKFESKKQQRFFFAKASDKSLPKKERKKWDKWSKEFSSDTDFDKIPNEIETTNVDEIVDEKGNMSRKRIPLTKDSKGGSKSTTDQVAKTAMGTMGSMGTMGTTNTTIKYWAESDMSKSLGFEKTMGKDVDKDIAKKYFEKKLGLDNDETEERLSSYGYDDDLSGDKVRLIENPNKYINDYVESVLSKKTTSSDLIKKDQNEDIESELNPIIKRQIESLKKTLKKNKLSLNDIMGILKKENEIDE
jgi:hypothetical protein